MIVRVWGFWPFSIEFKAREANKSTESYVYVKLRDWIWFIFSLVIIALLSATIIFSAIQTLSDDDLISPKKTKIY